MNYANLIQNITENIKTNGSQAITAQVLQDVLVDMVGELGQSGALLGGVIDTSFVPDPTNDAQVVYIAKGPGTYTNFNGLVVGAGEVAFFYFDGNAWAKSSVDVLEVVNNLNSTATDKALSAAMGKQIGDKISQLGQEAGLLQFTDMVDSGDIVIEQGSIGASGENISGSSRLRIKNAIPTSVGEIGAPDGFLIQAVFYYSAWTDSTHYTYTSFVPAATKSVKLDTTQNFARPIFRNTANNNITPSDLINSLYLISPKIDKLSNEIVEIGREVGVNALCLLVDSGKITIEQGTFNVDGTNAAASSRVRTAQAFICPEYIGAPVGYYVQFVFYYTSWTDASAFVLDHYDTINAPLAKITDTTKLVRISFRKINDAVIRPDVFLDALYLVSPKLQELQKRKTKTKADFVKYIDGYYKPIDKSYTLDANYETYLVHADGAKYVRAHIEGNADNLADGITCWSTGNPNTASRLFQRVNKNGAQDLFFEIPAGTKHISFSSLAGTLAFTLYYDELPESPNYELFVDELLNSDQSGGRIISNPTYDDRRVISKSICAFQEGGLFITAKLPFNIRAYILYTPKGGTQTVAGNTSWLYDGSTAQLPAFALEYRIVFAPINPDTTTTTLPASYVRSSIEAGELYFSFEHKDEDVLGRNIDKDNRVGAIKRALTGLDDRMDSLFVFGHISDIHGDDVRLSNFLQYLEAKGVDAAMNSGDSVLYNSYDYTTYCQRIAAQYNVPYFFCIGNHESQPTGVSTLFADNIQPLVSPYGYLKAANTPADDCYYYKDFAEKKIRLIVLNYYNNGVYAGSLGQAQVSWLISTLSSTPSGYGVLVMLHSAEDRVVASSPYDVFFQKVRYTSGDRPITNIGGNKPVMQIIDAFISRTSISDSYTDNGTTVNIIADFTGIASSIEFIAYITGHSHEDYIGYYENSTNRQLCLGITSGNALYGYGSNKALANQEDLPRGGSGVCQDAFNIYSIDRVRKVVKVARIGADLTFDFVPREYMEIPYAD